ncbi:MAG TPA: hypothetical protein VMT30_05105 [Candidatus Saccharimonadia bacterium]|nr:hypothetical protein [Candidatus Saccharimonadia bacterium]
MNKIVAGISLIAAVIAVSLAPHAAHAAAQYQFEGYVYDSDGQPVPQAPVTVDCYTHGGITPILGTTNVFGHFIIDYSTDVCPDGSGITVSAKTADEFGSTDAMAFGGTFINLDLHKVISVPEYGGLAGALAAGAGIGALAYTRRRHAQL